MKVKVGVGAAEAERPRPFLPRGPLGAALFLLVLAAGCASQRPLPSVEPVTDGRSRYGNGPIYEVHGRRYVVLDSSAGYHERGIASWYGKKFHGRLTSSREPYDMYALTAAHKTLPLPTRARVTNLQNGKSVVVRINDRGPFVANRLIDLSYAAASAIGIVEAGTGMVEVAALGGYPAAEVVAAAPAATTAEAPAATAAEAPAVTTAEVPAAKAPPQDAAAEALLYLQVGAFGDAENAQRRFALLQDGGIEPAFVREDALAEPALYRVRIGPIANVAQYDSLVLKLQSLGISEMHLVTE
ncbi:MAG TPA: septal ring lytic transglycosylase RlpA family protein [Woeseiaceae bacterium]|nr:septal ring lytic transglycosylase RlpA family protein [Woeseiaceae bacterium]